MIVEAGILDVIRLGKVAPIDAAAKFYRDNSTIDFFEDLADYLRTGVVVARPTCFGMAKLIWLEVKEGRPKERAWFVRYAIGNLRELLTCIPCQLDWIAFCRRGKETMHVWPFKRVIQLAYRGEQQ